MIEFLELKTKEFPINQIIMSMCKKSTLYEDEPEIDFLILQQKINKLQEIQQKTCQQIVQFVDGHCGQYIQINDKFQSLEDKISKVQSILKQVQFKVKDYAKVYYQNQAKIQQIISKYETKVIEKLLLTKCLQQSQFLSNLVSIFELIISKPMQKLTFRQRSLLIRFCKKLKYLQNLFNHHLLHQAAPDYIKVSQMVNNLCDEVQFYLSQQLAKLIKYKNPKNEGRNDAKLTALHQIKLCFKYLNKQSQYYKNIEQNLIGREMQVAQKNLIQNKINLISGKSIQIIQEYFQCLFNSISLFPCEYPSSRLLQLIFSYIKKPQIKFIFTYTLPIFPISYNCYMKCINSLRQQLRITLKVNHHWDLKRWIDVREKNILDRSLKDYQKGGQLQKWIDIVFKDNCKIQGVKNQIVRVAIKLITRYAKFIQDLQFNEQNLNKFIDIHDKIQKILNQKIIFFYSSNQVHKQSNQVQGQSNQVQGQSNQVHQQSNQVHQQSIQVHQQSIQVHEQNLLKVSKSIGLSCKKTLSTSIMLIIDCNTKLLLKSCLGCLQPYKSFIMKIIKSSKQLSQHGIINLEINLFRPLYSYLENNQKLTKQAKIWITNGLKKNVMQFYDQQYVTEIYQHSKANLSTEQFSHVMQIVGKERALLFNQQCLNQT